MKLDKRDRLLNQLSVLQNYVEDKWANITMQEVSDLEMAIEACWSAIDRRSKK